MIGGIDIRLPSAAGSQSIEVAVRAIRQLWPLAVFENGNTAVAYREFRQIPFGEVEELFVYRDPDAAAIWDQRGAILEVYNRMIHLLYDEGWLTIVIDERNDEMGVAIDAIRSALDDSIFSVPVLLEAA